MPFTAAHPAVVLPLRRLGSRGIPWSALAIGAMAPDLDYFLALRPHVGVGHTPVGTLTFCVPLGLILLVVFQHVLKRPLTLLLPASERLRLWRVACCPFVPRGLQWIAIAAAIFFGAWTHLAWDAFTHAGRWGTERFPILGHSFATVRDYDITVFKLLQHGSTVVGLAALAVAYLGWRRRQPATTSEVPTLREGVRWGVIATATALTVTAAAVHTSRTCGPVDTFHGFRNCLGVFVVSSISFGAIFLTLSALAVLWRARGLVSEHGS